MNLLARLLKLIADDPAAPGVGSVPVTPSNSTTYDPPLRSLYVTVAGDVAFTGVDGNDDTWTVPANYLIPVAMKKVKAGGTTATGLHGVK
jgi:hypothetical protein